jgi:ribosomal 50S subunit-recycling heat shock protein
MILEGLQAVREGKVGNNLEKLKALLQDSKKVTVGKLVKLTKSKEDYDYVVKYYTDKISGLQKNSVGYELYQENLVGYKKLLKEADPELVSEDTLINEEDVGHEITKAEVIGRLGVASSTFDSFQESIIQGGIFGRKLEGYKSETFGYKYVVFTHVKQKQKKFTLVALSNVKLSAEDVYYKVSASVLMMWDY